MKLKNSADLAKEIEIACLDIDVHPMEGYQQMVSLTICIKIVYEEHTRQNVKKEVFDDFVRRTTERFSEL